MVVIVTELGLHYNDSWLCGMRADWPVLSANFICVNVSFVTIGFFYSFYAISVRCLIAQNRKKNPLSQVNADNLLKNSNRMGAGQDELG